MQRQLILIHARAPAKPAWGESCNGCGLCCLAEPCPAGMLLTGRLHGACRLLRWSETQGLYRCGLLETARRPSRLAAWLQRYARRWIAAGQGCDARLEVEPPAR